MCVVDQHGLPVLLEADRVPVPAPAIRLDNGDRTTGRLGRYVCKAGPGDARRGKAQLPASSMQLIVAVTVTANGATVASVNGPNGEHGDGLSKAWLWWIGKGVTGWRRTIADAAFANTRSCRKGLDGRPGRIEKTDGRIWRQSKIGCRIQYCSRRRSRSWCCLFVRARLASLGSSCLEEEGGAADPFTSLFSPSRPMEPELCVGSFRRLLLHNPLLVVDCEVMRTTTRATCLAITREGGEGEERKRKKESEGIGRNENCPGKGKGRERRGEQASNHSDGTRATGKVARVSPVQPAMKRKGYFPVPACNEWDCDYDSPGAGRARTSVQSPQRAPPESAREETKGDVSAPSNFGSRTLLPHGGWAGAL